VDGHSSADLRAADGVLIHLAAAPVPHLNQYFGPWAIKETHGLALAQTACRLDLSVHLEEGRKPRSPRFQTQGIPDSPEPHAVARSDRGYPVADGTAVIELCGPLMKHTSSLTEGSSTVEARRQIRAAVADPDVSSILLLIDSPGGTAAGTQELADDVAWAKSQKPTFAHIDDLGASAAYWIASQADKVFANETALVGSIGTFIVVYDMSEWAANEGIKVHVVRAGKFKGMGVAGTEVTDEQLEELQRIVDALNSHFIKAVARGRGFDSKTAKELADGRIHPASEAKQKKLIDGVQSLDKTLAQLRNQKKPGGSRTQASTLDVPVAEETAETPVQKEEAPMAESPIAPAAQVNAPATLQELERVCPKAGADFLMAQLKRNATVEQARDAWTAHLAEQLESKEAELKKVRADSEDEECDDEDGDGDDEGGSGEGNRSKKAKGKAKGKGKAKSSARPGVEPIRREPRNEDEGSGDAGATFKELVAKHEAAGMPRARAVKKVVHEHPELREEMLAEANAGRPRASW
jgi:signal peptide peptidase SppA